MNEEKADEPEQHKPVQPASVVEPKGYRLSASSSDFWHSVYFSPLAWFSLIVGQIVSAIGCLVTIGYGFYLTVACAVVGVTEPLLLAIVLMPVAFLLQFASFVVFGRVSELESRYKKHT